MDIQRRFQIIKKRYLHVYSIKSISWIFRWQIGELRKLIKEAASEEPYMGEQMPICWLKFEQEIAKLVAKDTTHASHDQVPQEYKNTSRTFHAVAV